jgi:hypothetical protein
MSQSQPFSSTLSSSRHDSTKIKKSDAFSQYKKSNVSPDKKFDTFSEDKKSVAFSPNKKSNVLLEKKSDTSQYPWMEYPPNSGTYIKKGGLLYRLAQGESCQPFRCKQIIPPPSLEDSQVKQLRFC